MKIFDSETTNATSAAASTSNASLTVYCWGTFGGATVKLQVTPDGSEWFDVDDLTFTSKGVVNLIYGPGQVRGVISGGSGASINLEVK